MFTYLIAYDLDVTFDDYQFRQRELIEEIKKVDETCITPLGSIWFATSELTTAELRDKLRVPLRGKDKLFVMKKAVWASWGIKAECSNWLKDNHVWSS